MTSREGNTSAGLLSHDSALTRLTLAGVEVKSYGNCSDRHNSACTSLEGIRENTVSAVIKLKKASKCPITVTGGTEDGHAESTSAYTHSNGHKVNISANQCIDGFIKKYFSKTTARGDGAEQWKSWTGNVYTREPDHWDILYY